MQMVGLNKYMGDMKSDRIRKERSVDGETQRRATVNGPSFCISLESTKQGPRVENCSDMKQDKAVSCQSQEGM